MFSGESQKVLGDTALFPLFLSLPLLTLPILQCSMTNGVFSNSLVAHPSAGKFCYEGSELQYGFSRGESESGGYLGEYDARCEKMRSQDLLEW